ncbi:deoxyribonuclease-1-like 2 isoform 2-T2 [Liasis olivaceus]
MTQLTAFAPSPTPLFSFLSSSRRSSMKLAAVLLRLALLLHAAEALRICAFNIRSFGDTKLSDQSISKIIVKVRAGDGLTDGLTDPLLGIGWQATPKAEEGGGWSIDTRRERKAEPLGSEAVALKAIAGRGPCQRTARWGHWLTAGPGGPLTPAGLLCCSHLCARLFQILSRYDIILVQEVRDADLSAVRELMERLNRASKYSYDYVSSESLGRENYKEMYLFLYRTKSFSLVDEYQYPDPDSTFSRPPFIVKFAASGSKESELVLVPLHTSPSQAVAEIDALYDVYLKIIDKWETDNIMFLGDFNADCNYVGKKDWNSIRLRTSEVFNWLIPDDTDTTVGNSDCAYDRIVVSGSRLRKWIEPKSAKVFDFQRAFKLSQEEALAISDHFPVEVGLKSP